MPDGGGGQNRVEGPEGFMGVEEGEAVPEIVERGPQERGHSCGVAPPLAGGIDPRWKRLRRYRGPVAAHGPRLIAVLWPQGRGRRGDPLPHFPPAGCRHRIQRERPSAGR